VKAEGILYDQELRRPMTLFSSMFFCVSSLFFPGLLAFGLVTMNAAPASTNFAAASSSRFFSADNLLDLEQCFGFSEFHNS
jgi:hypothetical protein